MAMEQSGFVTEVRDGFAKVRVDRESACGGNCAGCHGCPQTAVLISCPVDPEKPVRIGEKVKITMPTGTFFSGMFKSYGILILMVLLGAIFGFYLTGIEGFSVLGALLGLLIGGVCVRLLSRKSNTDVIMEPIERLEGRQ